MWRRRFCSRRRVPRWRMRANDVPIAACNLRCAGSRRASEINLFRVHSMLPPYGEESVLFLLVLLSVWTVVSVLVVRFFLLACAEVVFVEGQNRTRRSVRVCSGVRGV